MKNNLSGISINCNAQILFQIHFEMVYISFIVSTKQKPGADTQRIKKGEAEHTILKNQLTKAGRKGEKKKVEIQTNQKKVRWH